MKHSALCSQVIAVVSVALTAGASVPNVDQNVVTLSQDKQSRLVTVSYELTGAPAVITVDFQTNAVENAAIGWTSIGEINFTNTVGDVNMVVSPGKHSICWQPRVSWPDKEIPAGKIRAVVKAWATDAPPDYCVISLMTDEQVAAKQANEAAWVFTRRRYFVSAKAVPCGVSHPMYKTENLLLRKIPAAGVIWRMGDYGSDSADLKPHKVMLTRDYYMGVYEFTEGQKTFLDGDVGTSAFAKGKTTWNSVRGTPWPDDEGNANHDVAESSILGVLRSRTGIASFDLPTEAQWEYACRAGMGGQTYNHPWTDVWATWKAALKEVAWCSDNYNDGNNNGRQHEVGLKPANDWGLYDMLGNANERTLDWYGDYVVSQDISIDPIGPRNGENRVWRGGSGWDSADKMYIAYRWSKSADKSDASHGFRVVCDAVAK